MAKYDQPEGLQLAGSTQWGTRHIVAFENFVVWASVGFLAQGHTHPIGQLLPLNDSGKQPSERLLRPGTCRRTNSHNSAITVVGACSVE